MDDATREKIHEIARQHGIAPDILLAALNDNDLPAELQDAVTAVLGDLTAFSHTDDTPKK